MPLSVKASRGNSLACSRFGLATSSVPVCRCAMLLCMCLPWSPGSMQADCHPGGWQAGQAGRPAATSQHAQQHTLRQYSKKATPLQLALAPQFTLLQPLSSLTPTVLARSLGCNMTSSRLWLAGLFGAAIGWSLRWLLDKASRVRQPLLPEPVVLDRVWLDAHSTCERPFLPPALAALQAAADAGPPSKVPRAASEADLRAERRLHQRAAEGEEYKMVLVVNHSLSMGKGKIGECSCRRGSPPLGGGGCCFPLCRSASRRPAGQPPAPAAVAPAGAQCAHAAVGVVEDLLLASDEEAEEAEALLERWEESGTTKVCLKAPDEQEMVRLS